MSAASPAPETFERSETDDVDISPDAGQSLVGTTIGARYEVRELIGSGAFGDVFRVEHVHLGREFALKVLKVQHTFDEVTVKRFRREARAAADIPSERARLSASADRAHSLAVAADLVGIAALVATGAGVYLWIDPPGADTTSVGVSFTF